MSQCEYWHHVKVVPLLLNASSYEHLPGKLQTILKVKLVVVAFGITSAVENYYAIVKVVCNQMTN